MLIAHFAVGDGPEAWGWAAATGVLWGISYFRWIRLQATTARPDSREYIEWGSSNRGGRIAARRGRHDAGNGAAVGLGIGMESPPKTMTGVAACRDS